MDIITYIKENVTRLGYKIDSLFARQTTMNEKIDEATANTEGLIDDINTDIITIQAELENKASVDSNHDHTNLTTLEKLSEDGTDLTYNAKAIMTKDVYDSNKDGIVDKSAIAIKLEGQLITLDELNALSGIQGNVQDLLDALSSGMDFRGEYATYADMTSTITTPQHGYQVIITADENYGGARTQYIYSSTVGDWVYGGGYSSVNDATTTNKGLVQLSGDLTGSASAPELVSTGVTAGTYSYPSAIEIDAKGRVLNIVTDNTLLQRVIDLENRPQVYVSATQPTTLKNGDFWIVVD